MKINLFTLLSLIIIIVAFAMLSSCKDKAREQNTQKDAKPAVDTTKPKVIFKKPSEEKPATIKPEPKIYIVKQGEWLWDIARKEYGTAIGWFRIYEANREKIADPELIYPGQRFVIPEFKPRK